MSGSDVVMRHFDVVTHVHGCFECPDAVERAGCQVCNQAPAAADVRTQNAQGLTPSCPQWPWSAS
jgi:G:T-mismatch repair DNA endonuclease (very short patch repair protein)